jgi:hypothetical protein
MTDSFEKAQQEYDVYTMLKSGALDKKLGDMWDEGYNHGYSYGREEGLRAAIDMVIRSAGSDMNSLVANIREYKNNG